MQHEGSKQQPRTETEFVRGSCVFFFLSFFSKQMCIYFLMFEVDDFQGVSFAKMCAGHYSKI